MYAIIATGGKQYKISENDTVRVEKLLGNAEAVLQLLEILLFNLPTKSIIALLVITFLNINFVRFVQMVKEEKKKRANK